MIELAIRRWQLTLVFFALLIALGYSAFVSIPRAVDPHFPVPIISILAIQPGADAAEMEQTVAKPIEEIMQGLEDIKRVSSTSVDSSTSIRAEFDWSGDPDRYFNDTVREVGAIRDRLPAGLVQLEFKKFQTTSAAVVQLALISDEASWRRLEKYGSDIREAMLRLPDVQDAELQGVARPEIRVAVKSNRLVELRLPATHIVDALRLGGADVATGAVTTGTRRLNVDAGGAYSNLDAVRNTPVRTGRDSFTRVGDVADVFWSAEETRTMRFHNGQRAAFLTVNQKPGTDASEVRNQLLAVLDQQKKLLPADISVAVQFDQTRDIEKRLAELARDFAIALALVLLTLLPLGIRAAVIVMIAIPLSLASGLIAVYASGYNLNQLVVAGFILSLGLLVDDSIVAIENISRHLRMGKSRIEAAIEGAKEIQLAIFGATGVLVFAFFPMLFLPEGAGRFTQSFIATIIFTVLASMLVSLTIIPFLASQMLQGQGKARENVLLRWLTGNIERFYRPLLHRGLASPRKTVWGALAITVSAVGLVPMMGISLFPNADTSYFRVIIDAEQGSSLAHSEKIMRQASAILAQESSIKTRIENVGARNPQIYYNVIQGNQTPSGAEIVAVMDKWDGERSQAMIDRLRKKLDRISGAQIKIALFQNGSPLLAPVGFSIVGPDLNVLKTLSAKVESRLHKVPGMRDIINPVRVDRIDLDMNIDEAKAALLDVPPGEARRAIRLALSGERAGQFRDNEGDSYPVIVRHPLSDTHPVSALDDVYVFSRGGTPVALGGVTTPELVPVPSVINRRNLERTVEVTAQVETGFVTSQLTAEAKKLIDRIRLPKGYRIDVRGESEQIDETFSGFGPIILTAVFIIFAILVYEFGEFREAIVVAGVIPLGLFGGLVALFVTGNSLSFLAAIGFVALVGIEIKNSILLVDFTSQLRSQGVPLREAIERAGETRFLPVLLTSVTAIGGLLPLAVFGGSLYGPLAIVLIGGLVSSTFLSRIVTPAMYLLIASKPSKDLDKPPAATPQTT